MTVREVENKKDINMELQFFGIIIERSSSSAVNNYTRLPRK